MEQVSLKLATKKDASIILAFDYAHSLKEHFEFKREEKINKAISKDECFIILEDERAVGFLLFDYRFFDQGWIDLIVIDEKFRGFEIGGRAITLICNQSKTNKVFTSTNRSNFPMQKALTKVGFTHAGKVEGLDEGDPELFYYKEVEANLQDSN